MPDFKFNLDTAEIGTKITELGEHLFAQRAADLITDTKTFVINNAQKLVRYKLELSTHSISQPEYDDLIKTLGALQLLEKHKQAGLNQIAVNQFVNGAIDILVTVAIKAIPIP